MKLKKIASLMLAGVMAVSMLAGCQNTSVDPEPTPDPDPTPVTGYSAKLQSELSAIAQDKITFSDSTELNSALEYAAGNIGNDKITGSFIDSVKDGKVTYIELNDNSALGLVVRGLRDALDVQFNIDKDEAKIISDLNPTTEKSWANWYAKNDVNTVLLYVVNDAVNLNNAMDQIADRIGNDIEELDDDFDFDGDGKMDVNYHYTGSVATCTKTYEAGHGMGLHIIAVELVRHIGK